MCDQDLLSLLARHTHAHTHKLRFQPQALSNLLWGFGRFGVCDQELLSLLAREAVYKADDLKPLGWTTILEAWARAGCVCVCVCVCV